MHKTTAMLNYEKYVSFYAYKKNEALTDTKKTFLFMVLKKTKHTQMHKTTAATNDGKNGSQDGGSYHISTLFSTLMLGPLGEGE